MIRYNDLKFKNFEITREVNKVLIDTDKLYMSLYAIAQVPGSSQEGYVFEIINKCPDSFYGEFSLGDRVGPLNAFGQASLQPGEKFYCSFLMSRRHLDLLWHFPIQKPRFLLVTITEQPIHLFRKGRKYSLT